jgi:DNA invertase Pin-like site-specific DNA recombinase
MRNEAPTIQTHPLVTRDHLRRLAVIYIRQSSEEQVRNNTGSTDYQRSLAAVARLHGWRDSLVVVIDEDLGITGSSAVLRSGWERLKRLIAEKKVGCVFVVTASRMARQLKDFEVFREIAAANRTLIYTDGRFVDLADSSDTVFSQVTAAFAHYENRKRTEIMSAARYIKARQGIAVSALPVGWIKSGNGKYEFDPQAEEGIRIVIQTFWETRSIRRTVKALLNAGIQIPARQGKQLCFKKPTMDRVKTILTHPAYSGSYVYGRTQCLPGGPVMPNGQTMRRRVSEEQWVKIPDHHLAYMTVEEQQEIKSIFSRTHFERRDRAGRGPALTQGLLQCATCGERLAVSYHRNKSYSYGCWKALKHAERPCTWFVSYDFDQYVLRELFKVLKAPPLKILKTALKASKRREQTRLSWIESERERLRREERRARERADLTCDSLESVYRDALRQLDKILKEKEQFEQTIASELSAPRTDESEEQLLELCQLASEVPTLWHHPAVTHQEKKHILRCVIDHIVVAASKERVDATIFWKTGEPTRFCIWRGVGRYNLIRELYQQKLTVPEIKEHLAAGKTSNGQVVNITEGRIYEILHKLGLTPNRFSAAYLELGQKAAELHAQGRSLEWIARYFNEQRFPSASGKAWTRNMVFGLRRAIGGKTELLEDIHRNAIAEARARGLDYQQMADEFNKKSIGRLSRRPWTERNVRKRCFDLDQLDHKRSQKHSTGTQQSEPADVLKSA